ncbi:MAG: hypothetical protein IR160_08990 [Salinibacterium sp.]|nr:hypothetical protein [Salinibacterium sp.]MBF0672707.1 hypothetical protein [Salinibacterium sp.]
MTGNTRSNHSRGDVVAMAFFMLMGGVFAIMTLVQCVRRTIDVLAGDGVRVFAEFIGTPADAPIGPGGAARTVELDSAWILPDALPAASVWALVSEQVLIAASVVTVIASLLALLWNVLRGRVFSRANTRLILTAGFAAFLGSALAPFFANMGANGAFAQISDGTFNNVVQSVEVMPLFAVAFLAALGGTVFGVGERLQRETEGLV